MRKYKCLNCKMMFKDDNNVHAGFTPEREEIYFCDKCSIKLISSIKLIIFRGNEKCR